VPSEEKMAAGRVAAARLGLEFEFHVTGYGELATSLERAHTLATTTMTESIITWQN
jgi:hypothetical protein